MSQHARSFFQGLQSFDKIQIGAVLVLLFLVTSKSLDGIDRKLGDLGVHVSTDVAESAEAFEEIMEFGIPLLMMATFATYRQQHRKKRHYHE